ncbi:MAG: DnaB-like helicase C-terminal domain-containing protein [Archaeoglobaceae archaeon]
MIGITLLLKLAEERRADILLRLPAKFFEAEEREFYRLLLAYYRKYRVLPPKEYLQKFYSLIEDYGHPLEYYIDVVKRRYFTKKLRNLKVTSIDEENVESVLSDLVMEYNKISSQLNPSVLSEGFNEKLFQMIEKLRRAQVIGLLGYSTGYPTIDEGTGGYIPGTLFVYVARMKMGKTMYLLNSLLKRLQAGEKCLFISMEMPFETIMKRLLAIQFKNPNFIRQDRLVSSFIDKELKEWSYSFVFVNGTTITNYKEIRSLIDIHKPHLVFIDGAYLLPLGYNARSEWERITTIVRDLNNIALDTNVPIVCTWQFNRQAVRFKDDAVEYIAYTDALAQSATTIVSIVDTDQYAKKKMNVIAVREGKGGSCLVHWDWTNLNFDECQEKVIEESDYMKELGFEGEIEDIYLQGYSSVGISSPEELGLEVVE